MYFVLLQEEAQELEEEKEEEPDRLTQLLPQSKFTCGGKKTGYYADDGLDCEVFHYCQDGARHSWICPEGFVFHQVSWIKYFRNTGISFKRVVKLMILSLVVESNLLLQCVILLFRPTYAAIFSLKIG